MQERTVAILEACNQMPWLAEQDEEEEVTDKLKSKEKLESKAEKINAGEPDASAPVAAKEAPEAETKKESAPVAAKEAPEAETKKEAPKPDGS